MPPGAALQLPWLIALLKRSKIFEEPARGQKGHRLLHRATRDLRQDDQTNFRNHRRLCRCNILRETYWIYETDRKHTSIIQSYARVTQVPAPPGFHFRSFVEAFWPH
jgi:hypothetical protein